MSIAIVTNKCTMLAILPHFIISDMLTLLAEKAVPVAAPAQGSMIAIPEAGRIYAKYTGLIPAEAAKGINMFDMMLTVAVPLTKLDSIAVANAATNNNFIPCVPVGINDCIHAIIPNSSDRVDIAPPPIIKNMIFQGSLVWKSFIVKTFSPLPDGRM